MITRQMLVGKESEALQNCSRLINYIVTREL